MCSDLFTDQTNKDVAREFCNENDNRSLLLKLYVSELDRPSTSDEEVETLLQQWLKVPGTFSSLRIAEVADMESCMSSSAQDAFRNSSIAFRNLSLCSSDHRRQ